MRSRASLPSPLAAPFAALSLGLLLTTVAALPACADADVHRPNVVFIVIDTLRADHLSAYGYRWKTSPRMDALAERGALFLDCTAQSSWTMPSMISLMTSRPVLNDVWRVPESMPVLAESFADGGYRTGGFAANSLLHEDAGFARGLQAWEVRSGGVTWNAEDVVGRAHAFLDADDERPFFLWLHFLDPHKPYRPRFRIWKRDHETVFDEAARASMESVIRRFDKEERWRLRGQRKDLAHDVDGYDGEVAFTDKQIGLLVDRLEADGVLDDTIIVILSDHGEGLYGRPEHPRRLAKVVEHHEKTGKPTDLGHYLQGQHGYWLYEELVRTPFIICGPGIAPGSRFETLVTNLDVAPTLLDLAGLPALPGARGRSLAAALGSGVAPAGAEFAVSACAENLSIKTPSGRKVIVPTPDVAEEFGLAAEHYDLSSDPGERLPMPLDDEARRLAELLRSLQAGDAFREFSGNQELDPDTEARLREMGYIR